MQYPAAAGQQGGPQPQGGATPGVDRVTQALMAIQQPPPQPPALQAPQSPMMSAPMTPPGAPPLSQPPAAAFPGGGMTGAVPNAPTAAQPMGGPPMPQLPGAQMPGAGLMQQPMPGR